MDERRVRGHGGPVRWWRTGRRGRDAGRTGNRAAGGPGGRRSCTAFVLIGSSFAAHGQQGGRVALDPFARVLLVVAAGLLLWRHRRPVPVVFGAAAVTAVYLGAGHPYGPVLLTVAVACFAAVVAGHRRAAWAALGVLWAAHLLFAHWLYRWLPPSGDRPASFAQETVVATWVVVVVR